MVVSDLASAISSGTARSEWPTFSLRSHSKYSTASTTFSTSAVGLARVRNIRSMSLNGAISPRPVPPNPTIASSGGPASVTCS